MFKKVYYLFIFINMFYWGWFSDETNMSVTITSLLFMDLFFSTWERFDTWFNYLVSRIDYIENDKKEGE